MVVSSQLKRPSRQAKAACRLLPSVHGDWKFLTSIRNEAFPRQRARTLGVRGGSHIARAFLILFLTGSIGTAVAATRESGLSVHMLPDRVARSIGGHGGFTVTDPPTGQRGTTYAHPEELLTYFQGIARVCPAERHLDRYDESQFLFRE